MMICYNCFHLLFISFHLGLVGPSYHSMHLEVPNYQPPPYVTPSTLSDGAIAAIVIVIV